MADFRTEITADKTQFDASMDAAAAKAMSTSQAIASAMRESSVKMQQSFKEANDNVNKQFDGIVAGAQKIRGAFAAIAAVVGGGAIFGKAVDTSKQITGEVMQLARTLGITSEQASTLRSALDRNGIGAEDYTAMIGKLTIKLRENEERFNELGVKTRGSNNELLNGQQVMDGSLQALLKFKEGTDRNLAATELFGRGWNEVIKLFKVTPAEIAAAQERIEDLQLTIGPDGVARTRAYSVAWKDLKEVGEALANRLGQALMPILTDLANFFVSMGPAAVVVMRGAIGGLAAVFDGLWFSITSGVKLALAAIYNLTEPFVAIGEAAALALSGKFEEAKDRLKQGDANIAARWRNTFSSIGDEAEKTRDKLAALFDPEAEQGKSAPGGKGGKSYVGKDKDKDKSRMPGWEAELGAQRDAYDKMKLEQGSFETYTKQMESDFWKQKIALTVDGTAERAETQKKYYSVERDIRKQSFEAEVADIHMRIAAGKAGSVERVLLAGEEAVLIGQKFGLGSKEYKKAQEEMTKYALEHGKQMRELENIELEANKNYQLSRVELERANLETLEQLGQIKHQDHLEALKNLKEIEYQINLQAMQRELQNYENDEVAYQKHLERIAQMKNQHEVQMRQIDGQIQVESFKVWREIGDAITGGFSTAVKGVIMGTQSLSQAFRNLGQTVLLSLIDMGAKWLAQKAINAVIGAAIDKGSSVVQIANAAAVAGANAFAATAAIPIIGPELAPGAAAAAFSQAMGFQAGLLSAAGGFDIPRGVNPITQLHQEEMVLPAPLANTVRDMAGGGTGGGGPMSVTIHALDAASFEELLMRDPQVLAKPLRRLGRNFVHLS